MDSSNARRLGAGTFEPSEHSEVDNIDIRRAGSPTPLSEASGGSQPFYDANDEPAEDNTTNNENGSAGSNRRNPTNQPPSSVSSSTTRSSSAVIKPNYPRRLSDKGSVPLKAYVRDSAAGSHGFVQKLDSSLLLQFFLL